MNFALSCAVIFCMLAFASGGARAAIVFAEDFSDNSAGWLMWGEWQIGPATASTGQSFGNPDPSFDHTPTSDNGVAGIVIGGNPATSVRLDYVYLISPAVDVIDPYGATGKVTLDYYRWLNSDYPPYMYSTIDVASNGSFDWVNIYTPLSPVGVVDDTWTLHSLDISAFISYHLRIRFGFAIFEPGAFAVSSWNIDDITISNEAVAAPVPLPAALPLFAASLAAMGFMGWRKRRKAT